MMINNTINKTINVVELLTNKIISINEKTNQFITEQQYTQLDTKLINLQNLLNKNNQQTPEQPSSSIPDEPAGNYKFKCITAPDKNESDYVKYIGNYQEYELPENAFPIAQYCYSNGNVVIAFFPMHDGWYILDINDFNQLVLAGQGGPEDYDHEWGQYINLDTIASQNQNDIPLLKFAEHAFVFEFFTTNYVYNISNTAYNDVNGNYYKIVEDDEKIIYKNFSTILIYNYEFECWRIGSMYWDGPLYASSNNIDPTLVSWELVNAIGNLPIISKL